MLEMVENIEIAAQVIWATMAAICGLALCFGGSLPEIPCVLFMASTFVMLICDYIKSYQEWREKRRRKATQRSLISL